MRLAGTCLAISEYGAVVSTQHIRDNVVGGIFVDLLLGCIRLEDFVEYEHFTLKLSSSFIALFGSYTHFWKFQFYEFLERREIFCSMIEF